MTGTSDVMVRALFSAPDRPVTPRLGVNLSARAGRRAWLVRSAVALALCGPLTAAYALTSDVDLLDLTGHWTGWLAVGIFVVAYVFVVSEHTLGLRKSMPALLAAGLIWFLVAWAYSQQGQSQQAETVFRRGLEYYTELFLFLLAAMTYINAMSERGVFAWVRHWLATRQYSFRTIYGLSGALAFVISPFADNLTTALLLSAAVVSIEGDRRFATLACINIVVAANAGGVFSPFGDVTTLLVWQRGLVEFSQFFTLFGPALVSWLIPALIMGCAVPAGNPAGSHRQASEVADGGAIISLLFLVTIGLAVTFENNLHLPAAVGMMTGLGLLKLYGYVLKKRGVRQLDGDVSGDHPHQSFDIFRSVARAEWDTLLFLLGILMSVAGLAAMGWLLLASEALYSELGTTVANILVGLMSALVENVPMMFTVLGMRPAMDTGQWLLVTLTTGVGGSLLSIGSAAGVAVMGQARQSYHFVDHLKWSWAIALGYAASVWLFVALMPHQG